MKIDGKEIADEIFADLKERVERLKNKGIQPHLVAILVGNDPASEIYVNQKQIKSHHIGAKVTILKYPTDIPKDDLILKILELNDDKSVHGIIVQRPLPRLISSDAIDNAVMKEKDIDGFRIDSPYDPPIAEAVYTVLEIVHGQIAPDIPLFPWPGDIKVVLIGKGETAGKPIHTLFDKLGIPHTVIDSQTNRPEELLKMADIIVSAVGKKEVILPHWLKKGVILISIGMHKEGNKTRGDYDDEAVANLASFYTPTPGGIGPINVAMLLQNLIESAERSSERESNNPINK